MNDYITRIADDALYVSAELRQVSTARKNAALTALADLLVKHSTELKAENARDIAYARETGLEASLVDRLTISDKVIQSMSKAALEIAALPDPVGEVVEGRTLASGIRLTKVRAPLGVVALIYESRPNVTIDVGALCLKSGNAAILRGGKEAIHSNRALTKIFHEALATQKIPAAAVQLIEKTERSLIVDLVKCTRQIDLVVPRGGEALIQFVTENSLIPVVKHDKGVCNIYIEKDAPLAMAENIVINAKTQRPGVCNTAECLLIHKEWPHGAALLQALQAKGVTLHSDAGGIQDFEAIGVQVQPFLNDLGFGHEYLSLDIGVRMVDNLDEAVKHILEYGSKHSEAIITQNMPLAQKFIDALDSAAVFVNASTRFHDGGEFGLGAEVGIATGKLHVRGPMGLKDLTTTRYIAMGHGEIRN
ncbi:MAG: glutamate-5-semialdehyde dehydrogenase [Spirochaetes bacterium]|nr:glutamate-5-semialdehyde dehydrogenase [Spirochaetota bacterium]MBX3723633.1 glutamate-5-semialdehyde dehydrogenase [Turneriella sp.]